MKKNKNKKGFTMIELLAAIVIVGILSTIGIVSVLNLRANQRDKYNNTQNEVFSQTAETYFADNRQLLPKTPFTTEYVTLGELMQDNYLTDNFLDFDKNAYKPESKVYVTKLKNGKYVYRAELILKDETKIESVTDNKATIEFTYKNQNNNTMNKVSNTYYTNNTPKIEISMSDTDKIGAYTYQIYRNGKVYKTSEYIYVDELVNFSDTISLNTKDFNDGEYRLRVTVYDSNGNSISKNSALFVIDTTNPTCNLSISGTKGDNNWYKEKNVTINLEKNDEKSGIATYGLTNTNTTTYNSKTSDTQSDTSGITWYGYVKDNAGNTNSCEVALKVDTKKPTCSISKKDVDGEKGWYKTYVDLTLNKSDVGSGLAYYGLVDNSTVKYNNSASNTQKDTSGITWYGYVKDKAGNVNNCNSGSFKVDTIKPTCEVNLDGTKGEYDWYKEKNVTVSLEKNDERSGLVAHGLIDSSTTNYNSKTSGIQSNTSNVTWYGYVKDEAGNTNSCNSGNFKVDIVKPSCSFSNLSDNTIVAGNTATVDLTCTDSLSKINNNVNTLYESNFTVSSDVAKIKKVDKPTIETNGYKYVVTIEALKYGDFSVSLNANSLKDFAGNKNDKTTTTEKMTAYNKAIEGSCVAAFTYDGDEHTLASGGNGISFSNHKKTDAGTYTITMTPNETYMFEKEELKKTCQTTIYKRKVTYNADKQSKVYDETELNANTSCTITAGTLASGHKAGCDNSGSRTDAGTSTKELIKVTITDSKNNDVTSNYNITKNNGVLEVTRKPINVPGCDSKTYNGSSQTLFSTSKGYTAGGTTSGTNAGTYTATATPTDNYMWSDNSLTAKNISCTINKKSLSVSWQNKDSFVYNGGAQAPSVSIDTGISSDIMTVERTTKTDVGDHTSTASCSGVTVNGVKKDCSNFELKNTTKDYKITRKPISVPTCSKASYTYDGSSQTLFSSGTGYSAGGTTSATNAGTYTATATPTSNYMWNDNTTETKNVSCTIDRKSVNEPSCTARTYTGESQTMLAAKTSGEYTNEAITGTNAGDYSKTLVLNSNYKWSSGSNVTSNRTKTCTIAKATATITCQNKNYTGLRQTIAKCEGGTVSGESQILAGDYDITCTGDSNHTDATSKTCSIAKVKATISCTNPTYNGSPQNVAKCSGGTINGASQTSAGSYDVTCTGDRNHTDATPKSCSMAKATATITCKNPTYNGSFQDIATCSGGTANGANKKFVGSYDVTCTGDSNHNDATSKSCPISKANISPSVSMEGYTYGGTKSSPGISGNTGNGTVTYYYNTSNSNSNGSLWSDVSNATSLNAGTYYMYAVVGETDNYKGATTATKAFTIAKANDTITISQVTADYDGQIKNANVRTGSGALLSLTYYSDSSCNTKTTTTNANSSGGAPKNAGVYYIIGTTNGSTNYNGFTSSCSKVVTIKKITPSITLDSYSGSVYMTKAITFKEKANVEGSFSNTSNNTSYATVSPANSGNISANTYSSVTITGKSNGSTSINVAFTPRDSVNYNSTSATYSVTIKKPDVECGTITGQGTSSTWTNAASRSGTIKCVGSGCQQDSYDFNFSVADGSSQETGTFSITGKSGITIGCTIGVYIDRIKPTVTSISNPFAGNWANKSNIDNSEYKLTVKGNDTGGSGIAYWYYGYIYSGSDITYYTYDKSSYNSYGKTEFVTSPFTSERNGTDVYIRVCDNAGNCSDAKTSKLYIDTTAPTCQLGSDGTTGNSYWYISHPTVSFKAKNDNTGGSGLSAYGITTSTTATYNSLSSTTHNADGSLVKYYGYVKDTAGNTGSCNTQFAVDATAPTNVTVSNDLSKWTNSSFPLNLSAVDETSGVTSFQYKYGNGAIDGDQTTFGDFKNLNITHSVISSKYTATSNNFVKQRNTVIYVRACDAAGNCSSDSYTPGNIKIDKTPPTVKYKMNSAKTAVTMSCSDTGGSGVTSGTSSSKTCTFSGTSSTCSKNCTDNAGTKVSQSVTYKYDTCSTSNYLCDCTFTQKYVCRGSNGSVIWSSTERSSNACAGASEGWETNKNCSTCTATTKCWTFNNMSGIVSGIS